MRVFPFSAVSVAGGDYVTLSGAQMTFSLATDNNADTNTSCVTVTINSDNLVECDEAFMLFIRISSPDDGALSLVTNQSTVIIQDSNSMRKDF